MPKRLATAFVTALALAGCSSHQEAAPPTELLASTNFDNLNGWLADAPALLTLNRDKAHSGKYSTMVNGNQEFSLGYSNSLAKLAPDWPAKLKISAWVFLPNESAAAKLVTQVKPAADGPNLLWEGFDLAKNVKGYNKWQRIEQIVTLPDSAKADSRLLVYLWRADSKDPVYLDDLEISLAK